MKLLSFVVGLLITANLVGAEKFMVVDIFVDSGSQPLAAFQIEFRAGKAKIIGIEGGEHEAFKDPARYDPKALQQNRVVLAAFSTALSAQLPKGKTRVATLHLQASEEVVAGDVRAIVMANDRGERIDAVVDWRERVKQ